MQLKELMSEKFSLVGESASIAEARAKLSTDDYLVVTTDEGLPVTVITEADLPATGRGKLKTHISTLPVTVIMGCDLDISTLTAAPAAKCLLRKGMRGATLLDEQGVVGVLPAKAIRSHIKESASKGEIAPADVEPKRKGTLPKRRTIPFSFETAGKGIGDAFAIRSLQVVAGRTLGGNRAVPAIPRGCKTCGYVGYYAYILPTTLCKNPKRPAPWPHTVI